MRPSSEAMAIDTAPATELTLLLSDDLAETPGGGVERAVDRETLAEADAILAPDRGVAEGPGVDVWVLRDGADGVSALVAERDGDTVALCAFATLVEHRRRGHGEHLLRAVLGHYALEGATVATVAVSAAGDGLCRRIGFA